jgi:hypothetical protein
MTDQSEQEEGERDVTEHFEGILGREVAVEEADVILLRVFTGSSWLEDNGRVTSRDAGTTGGTTKRCTASSLLFTVDGLAATRADGRRDFLLSDFHCRTNITVRQPIIALATVQRREPVFVTMRATAVPGDRDVRLELFTWDPNGSPAGNVLVHWRCRFPFTEIIQ